MYGSNYVTYRGFPPPRTPKGTPTGRLVRVHFFSPALKQRREYIIYLPPGYARAAAVGGRFPVLYFLHGSPSTPEIVFNAAKLAVDYNVLLHHHRIKPFLMVMPDGRNGTFMSDTEWANTIRGGRYGGFVMDVVHAVDKRWATLRGRKHRMLAGFSEGAYGAMNLSLHHLRTFGSIESWSGYTRQLGWRGVFLGEPLSVVDANQPNLYIYQVANQVRRLPLRAYIYTSTRDRDAPQVITYANELRAVGGRVKLSIFRGGHDWRMWRIHAPAMLEWASQVFQGK